MDLFPYDSPSSHIVSAEGTMLKIQEPNQAPQTVQLAGLVPAAGHWQAEANGVISMLMESTQGQVSVQTIGQTPSGESLAIVELPNGTTLQQILLENGIVKLDPVGVKSLPAATATQLRQAQTSAQAEHKNIWSQGSQP